ncbi:unnamed protein product [Caenorhabditis sp. 36 PRJEB53466]|nr:unnamed protein product [Caenorhabditis sp. 36 PRJEB53466]
MGNLPSLSNSVAENVKFLEKESWISRIIVKLRQLRQAIRLKIAEIFEKPTVEPMSPPPPDNLIVMARDEFEVYQENIRNYIDRETRMVYLICVVNIILACIICKLLLC